MSAYICMPEHIGLLAAWAVSAGRDNSAIYEWRAATSEDTAARIAENLWQANLNSVRARYPSSPSNDLAGPCLSLADQHAAVQAYARHYVYDPAKLASFKGVDILSMANCLDYQSCETEDWPTSLAARQLNWIRSKAYRLLPGYEDAPWEYTEKEPLDSVEALYATE